MDAPTPTPAAAVPAAPAPLDAQASRRRWFAFFVLCMGTMMIVIDTTIVNLASPAIKADLGFSDAGLAWVVNAYMLTFGGFLLLGGRMGDLYGPRKLFLGGLVLFTLASLACGVAQSQAVLIGARAAQGLGAAVTSAVSLSLIMGLFPDLPGRSKAMGYFGFVASGGGAVGSLLSSLITPTLGWHWNFLINIPIGIAVFVAALAVLPDTPGVKQGRLDIAGAVAITSSLLLAVFAVVETETHGWTSATTLLRLACAAALLALFVVIEKRAANPLMPLTMFRSRNLVVSNIMGVLWAGSMFAWFFLSAQYMQNVAGFSYEVMGLAFLPANLIMAAFSVGLSAKIVGRFGIRGPVAVGLALAGLGLLLFARAPEAGNLWLDVVPPMAILGVGAGMAFNPMLLAAMSDAKPAEAGLASGLVNTSFMMGGALGLAVLTSLAAAQHDTLAAAGATEAAALLGGYRLAFLVGAACAGVASLLGAFALRVKHPAPGGDPHAAPVP